MATRTKSDRGGKVKRTKKPPRPPFLPVRISTEQIDRIDALRPDMIPREPFIRHVLDLGIEVLEDEG
jgi:hypothetical protein